MLVVAAAAYIYAFFARPIVVAGFFFPKKKLTFSAYEYKFIMAMGMASIESVKMQSRIGDKGGIDCIIGTHTFMYIYVLVLLLVLLLVLAPSLYLAWQPASSL